MKRRQLDGLVIYKLKVVKGDSNKSNFLDLLEIINNKVIDILNLIVERDEDGLRNLIRDYDAHVLNLYENHIGYAFTPVIQELKMGSNSVNLLGYIEALEAVTGGDFQSIRDVLET